MPLGLYRAEELPPGGRDPQQPWCLWGWETAARRQNGTNSCPAPSDRQQRCLRRGLAQHTQRTECQERSRCPALSTLTRTGKDVGILLIGAQEAHQLRGLHVIQGEEADVVLGVGTHGYGEEPSPHGPRSAPPEGLPSRCIPALSSPSNPSETCSQSSLRTCGRQAPRSQGACLAARPGRAPLTRRGSGKSAQQTRE